MQYGRAMRRAWACAVLALAILSVLAPEASALDPSSGTLRSPRGYVGWSGEFVDAVGFGTGGVAAACSGERDAACDTFTVDVRLPADVWAKAGGVQIAIDWKPHEDQDLDLYVYGPEGNLVGQSDSIPSTGESVRIASAPNGTYTVRVVPKLPRTTVKYFGSVEVEYEPAKLPKRELLPNLNALAPRNVHTVTGDYYVDFGVPIGANGCYPEEIVEQGAQTCLRFDQIVANTGEGPFELRYRMEGLLTEQDLVQRIHLSDGGFRDRKADSYEFHPVHAHFHYKNFGQSHLYKANPDGSKGKRIRSGKKNGFCMIDVENVGFGRGHKGEAPKTYYFPRCNAPTERDETGTYMTNGISPGWADVYNWYLADQMIEITGIAPGRYVLETVADPADTIRESKEKDQSASILIDLAPDGTARVVR